MHLHVQACGAGVRSRGRISQRFLCWCTLGVWSAFVVGVLTVGGLAAFSEQACVCWGNNNMPETVTMAAGCSLVSLVRTAQNHSPFTAVGRLSGTHQAQEVHKYRMQQKGVFKTGHIKLAVDIWHHQGQLPLLRRQLLLVGSADPLSCCCLHGRTQPAQSGCLLGARPTGAAFHTCQS